MLEKNLEALVQEEIQYGKSGDVLHSFTQSERLMYESQEFQYTANGFLVKKKHVEDADYDWDILKFIKNNPEAKEQVTLMLSRGERLLRNIYTNKDNFETWSKFAQHLREEGFELEDHVDLNELLSQLPAEPNDAMSYIEQGISLETIGNGAIYRTQEVNDAEEKATEQDYLGDLFDHYKSLNQLPRDKYRVIRRVGYTEEQREGLLEAENREFRAVKLCTKFKSFTHKYQVAQLRNKLAEKWKADKLVYKEVKNRAISISDASENIYLNSKQWRQVFDCANKAWFRTSINDEIYWSKEAKKSRQLRSNSISNALKDQVDQAKYKESVENIMNHAKGSCTIGLLWKDDYEKLKAYATSQWYLLDKRPIQKELDEENS